MRIRIISCRLCAGLVLATWMILLAGQLARGQDSRVAIGERFSSDKASSAFRAYDGFDGKLTLKWEPVRHDPTHVSLAKNPGELTITTQRGTIHANEKTDAISEGTRARNLYLIRPPTPQGGDFVMTTRVASFAPTTHWQQAGLMVYNDDANYIKCNLEWNRQAPSKVAPVLLRETQQQPDHFSVMPKEESNSHWLRVTKRGKLYKYDYSTDGENYTTVGEKPWGDGAPKWVGVFAKNGGNPLAQGIDARFDFFEVRSLTDAERNDPAHLEQQKLQGTWEFVSFHMSGKQKQITDAAPGRFVFDDGQLLLSEKQETLKMDYTLDVAKKPKQLVLSAFLSQHGGPVRAVYSVHEDSLTICLDPRPGAPPPTDLNTTENDGRLLFKLRREKTND